MKRSADSRPLVPRPAEPEPEPEPEAEPLAPADAELIAASRAADAAAYATLYERHVAAARNLARQLVHGRAEADDIVAESFAKVLGQLRRGRGPDSAFRPYLLTTVRRVAIDRARAEGKLVVSGEMEAFDPGIPFADPALARLERSMIARAFTSLPERWRAVLWHTEIEGARPAEVATMLGLTANGAAALAYRAREGLRQAYLQMHLSGAARGECRPVAAKLGAYVRGGLAKRETTAVAAHLDQCDDCRAVYLELAEVNVALRGAVAPIVLGPVAAAYLASMSHGALLSQGGSGPLGWVGGRLTWFRRAPKSQQAATAGIAAAAVAALAVLAFALTANTTPAPSAAPPRPVPPAPSPAPPAAPVPPAGPASPHPAPPVPPAAPRPAPPPARHPAARPASRPAPRSPRHTTAPPPARLVPPPSATPDPAPDPTPTPPVQLAARINPVGTLLRGGSGLVEFTVTNPGGRPSRQVTADIALPSGVSYVDPPIAGGWTCQTASAGASCVHGPLAPGTVATGYLPVAVGASAPLGSPPRIAVSGGGPVASATAKAGVAASGLGARFAATGRYTVATAGASLPGYPWMWGPWIIRPGWMNHGTWWAAREAAWMNRGISAATLSLPGRVQWAGLYWAESVHGARGDAVELRGPGDDYLTVAATDIGSATAPDGRSAFEAFADVTSLVARDGAGSWSAVPARVAAGTFGWTLVVVTADPGAAPGTQVMVLDGAHVVDAGSPCFSVPLGALPPGHQAIVRTVTWTAAGPEITTFAQNLAESPAVTFIGGNVPYLAGVVAVTDPPQP